MSKKLLPNTTVSSVRADTPIAECVKILRNKNIGALIVLSDSPKEGICGIFTERDLVKNIELIQRGDFWDMAVRTVMTTPVRTVTIDELDKAPKIMAKYRIRHLPVVSVVKGRTTVVGVISMRDVFSHMLEGIGYNLNKIFASPVSQVDRKFIGVFSGDRAFISLAEKSAELSKRTIMQTTKFDDTLSVSDYLSKFEAILIDLDGMGEVMTARVLAFVSRLANSLEIVLIFSPNEIKEKNRVQLHNLSSNKHVHLLSKPISFGLLYEHFIKKLKRS